MADIQDSIIPLPLRPKADRQTRTNSEQDDKVITKPLTPEQALTRLREVGVVEGIAEFARIAGLERTAASRIVDQWARDGKVVCRTRPGRKTTIEAVVTGVPVVQPPVQPVQHDYARVGHAASHAPLVREEPIGYEHERSVTLPPSRAGVQTPCIDPCMVVLHGLHG